MSDEEMIQSLIVVHFEPMRWNEEQELEWEKFRYVFLEGALLCGAARPAQVRSPKDFIERMATAARSSLRKKWLSAREIAWPVVNHGTCMGSG